MRLYKRVLNLPALLRRKSFFLLGPRQTGKSTLLKSAFPDAHYVDLLEADAFRELSAYMDCRRIDAPLTFWRTLPSGLEVDFVVGDEERRRRRNDDGVEVLPVEEFFTELWSGGIIQ